jgi:hypothetical protein
MKDRILQTLIERFKHNGLASGVPGECLASTSAHGAWTIRHRDGHEVPLDPILADLATEIALELRAAPVYVVEIEYDYGGREALAACQTLEEAQAYADLHKIGDFVWITAMAPEMEQVWSRELKRGAWHGDWHTVDTAAAEAAWRAGTPEPQV